VSPEAVRDAFRRWGFLQADLDALGRLEPIEHPALSGSSGPEAERCRRVWCGPIGVELAHVHLADRVSWVAERMETEPRPPDRERLVRRLAEAEVFERFLHRRYVGSKRYSLEGCAALVPLLDEILDTSAGAGAELCLIGMGHRGRLNVMVHIANRPAEDLFAHYEDAEPRTVLGSGDVRYHLGATGDYTSASGRTLRIHLVSNPSHLEAVDPVMLGRARARQERAGAEGPRRVLPLLLHGDGAFAGQGIAAEALNFDGLDGFGVGGTVHVVVNNLIGFTTSPRALHGSRYATDVAKRLPIPILHVNGEDPEAVARVGRIAAEYRARFASDVVVDLIGYRRYGHSELDDPTTTHPLLYRRIAERPALWEAYAERVGMSEADRARLEAGIVERLTAARDEGARRKGTPSFRTLPDYWAPYRGGRYRRAEEIDTGVPAERLRTISERIATPPPGFTPHPKVAKLLDERREMGAGGRDVDWGMAEALAFGSLLLEGTRVRLAGEDSRRGTFNHRHAVLIDHATGREHLPLAALDPAQAPFAVYDTPLSEAAALGFEYGYSRDYPEALVCWEAQFGDFVNGAQVIIDQFVAASEDKWALLSGLVLLLPHGFEGQGPEHSSARPERFLQLAGEDNLQICQPSTAAQHFHLLRRQARRPWRKPLVVLTPKGLLRAPDAASPLETFTTGRFRPVLDDPVAGAERLLLCSGKIAHELRAERKQRGRSRVSILVLEQLYPFPEVELAAALDHHPAAREIVWVQEEPANMGALAFVRPRLQALVGNRHVTTVKRAESASPATGSFEAHRLEQARLLELAFAPRGGATVAPADGV
jgi:2-oxoglutarate dehydrogenase E1 component